MIISRVFISAVALSICELACAQQGKVPSLESDPYEFKCVMLILNQEVRDAGSYIGKLGEDIFFIETRMLGIGPLLLHRKAGFLRSEIYAPSKISTQCASMELELERVEKKFPHAAASLVAVKPSEAKKIKISILPGRGEFGRSDFQMTVYENKESSENLIMYRADNFLQDANQSKINLDVLDSLSREFCQIVNGDGGYAKMVEGCVLSTKGQ